MVLRGGRRRRVLIWKGRCLKIGRPPDFTAAIVHSSRVDDARVPRSRRPPSPRPPRPTRAMSASSRTALHASTASAHRASHCAHERTSQIGCALANFRRPIIVENLLDEWPASNTRRWSFSALRARIGHALVDCGSSTGGVPFYLVAANAERSAGRADLALYVFDSDFSDDSGKVRAAARRLWPAFSNDRRRLQRGRGGGRPRSAGVAVAARRAGGLRHLHASGPVVVLVVERVARRLEAVGALPARRVARDAPPAAHRSARARRGLRRDRAAAPRRRLHGRDSAGAARLRPRRGRARAAAGRDGRISRRTGTTVW